MAGGVESKETWRILLIDDDEDDYIITRELLSAAQGRRVKLTWAPSFDEGRQLMLKQPHYAPPDFEAVLLDYDLGSGTGIQLAREVKEKGYEIPMILLTGRGSYEVDLEAMEAGMSLYLTKTEANALLLERSIRYAIERKNAEKALSQRNGRLSLLSYLSSELLRSRDPVVLLDDISARLADLLGLDIYVHYQKSPDGQRLDLAALGGYDDAIRQQLMHLELGQAVCGMVALTSKPDIVEDVQHRNDEKTSLIRSLGVTAYACHPLIAQGKFYGTLSFGSRSLSRFASDDIDLLRTVCDLIAVAFERREKEQRTADLAY